MKVLVNATANTVAGGFTVARRLTEALAIARPGWQLSVLLSGGVELHHKLANECVANRKAILAPASTSNRAQRFLYLRSALRRWVQNERADVVMQMDGMFVGGLSVPTFCHCGDPWPYLSEAQTGRFDWIRAGAKRRAYGRALQRADSYGFTSKFLQDLMLRHHHVTPKRNAVYFNGVPQDWSHRDRTQLADPHQRPLELLTVGNICPYKGQHLVIQALPALLKRDGLQDLRYRLVGTCDAGYRNELETMIRSLGLTDRVRFDGLVSDDGLKNAYARARCFVFPSVCESFGIPPLEAMSFRTPVAAMHAAALPEICGDAADYFHRDKPDELVHSIANILLNQDHAIRLADAGEKRVKQFDWQSTGEQVATELEKLVNASQLRHGYRDI